MYYVVNKKKGVFLTTQNQWEPLIKFNVKTAYHFTLTECVMNPLTDGDEYVQLPVINEVPV